MGKPVNKNYAKKIEIPTPTEWELKTHSYTEELIEHKNKILKKRKVFRFKKGNLISAKH